MSICIENLSHVYLPGTPFERVALSNITFDVETGTCIGIAGQTASGKSTLVQHLNGLLKPTSGRITVNGVNTATGNLAELRKQVGIVFQYPEQQLFGESVYKDIAFGLSNIGMGEPEIGIRVLEALCAVGLGEDLLDASPFSLSGGQKRRVAIAGILVMRPSVLILDEPSAGLDPQGRREILDFIGRLHRRLGITILLASHCMDDIVRLADRVVVLKQGEVAMQGNTRELLRNLEALESTGMTAPPITSFMNRMKKELPELNGCLLTVEEARDELKRVWKTLRKENYSC
ncbi:MAG: energy-coupling factor transporter ATPase [Desulfuromonadaceae bacterium]|nr:energy-coupling factor transporter ATPase [Desulfuromonadaceae bacterium]MDD5106223.1 energy-coupling factor transporter ATPase [Desulfuromonadaceae bacterium]